MLSIKQAAEILNVHWKTVYNHILDNSLKAYKIGRQWRIKETDLDNYAKPKENTPP